MFHENGVCYGITGSNQQSAAAITTTVVELHCLVSIKFGSGGTA
jgi:hypothetical protein